ncbi:hypothetical protein Q9L58_007002 [Maublancomyces gigas]|uniref:F-box domain-containing protein n=1 Tax=Discina gigas TaxID=1032678 RepID=A0ABR3GDQ7_9PEZI
MTYATDARGALRSEIVKRFSTARFKAVDISDLSSTRGFDVFGSLPRDVQIDVLGYVAVHRPAQVLLMRKVCKRWRGILSDDSIYHSAMFTASFSLPPPRVSLEAFGNTAWSDDRIRRFRLSKGRTIWYTRDLPNNNVMQPNNVIYRDGFIVWWIQHGRYFSYVDLNQAKNAKRSFVVDSGFTRGWEPPLYAQADGKLIFGEICEENDQRRLGKRLYVVLLQDPPQRGEICLSAFQQSSGGAIEIYCSGQYAVVLNGLRLLVADIRDVTATKVLRIIHLNEHTVSDTPSCDE